MMHKVRIAQNIRFWLAARNNKVVSLAKAINLGKTRMYDIVNAKAQSVDHYIPHIARGLQVEPSAITGDDSTMIQKINLLTTLIEDRVFDESTKSLAGEMMALQDRLGYDQLYQVVKANAELAYFTYCYDESYEIYSNLYEIAEYCQVAELQEYLDMKHTARRGMANSLFLQGQYERAKRIIESDLQEVKDPLQRAKNYQLLGLVYKKQFEQSEAEKNFSLALNILSECDLALHNVAAQTHQYLGDLYREVKKYDLGIRHLMRSIELTSIVPDVLTEIYAHRSLALIAFEIEDIRSGIMQLKQLQQKLSGSSINKSEILINQFYIHRYQQEYDLMVQTIQELETTRRPPREMSKIYKVAGELAALQKRWEDAYFYSNKSNELMYN